MNCQLSDVDRSHLVMVDGVPRCLDAGCSSSHAVPCPELAQVRLRLRSTEHPIESTYAVCSRHASEMRSVLSGRGWTFEEDEPLTLPA